MKYIYECVIIRILSYQLLANQNEIHRMKRKSPGTHHAAISMPKPKFPLRHRDL